MNDVKAAFKSAFLSIPEGSTCYWLVKRKSQHGRMEKINEIAANEKTDIYEEILITHGVGEYLVWLMDNNDKKLIEMPIRFVIPGEQHFDDDEDLEDEEEDPAALLKKVKRGYAKKLQDDLELEEILSIRERLHGKKETVNTNHNNDFIQALERIERKNEERERRLEDKINNMQQNQQQGGIFALIAEMQKSNANMTQLMMKQQSENQKLSMERDAKSQDLIIALLKKDDSQKSFWDSPFFLEVYKKATEKPKSVFDDSMGKMLDMFFQTQQQTVQKMLDIQLEAGQNDMFFQRMKVFKDMAAQVGPGIKDFALRWASIKAAKETEQEKIRAQNNVQEQTQQPPLNKETPQQHTTRPKVVVVKKQNPQINSEPPVDHEEEDLKRFFFMIYNRIVENDNIDDIEREIRQKPGAVEAIKTRQDLQEFVDSEGGRIKELFDRIRNEAGNDGER